MLHPEYRWPAWYGPCTGSFKGLQPRSTDLKRSAKVEGGPDIAILFEVTALIYAWALLGKFYIYWLVKVSNNGSFSIHILVLY